MQTFPGGCPPRESPISLMIFFQTIPAAFPLFVSNNIFGEKKFLLIFLEKHFHMTFSNDIFKYIVGLQF